MKCLILAAGYATRLYPLTENYPKPLLQVGEKTILDWLIDDLKCANVIDKYIVVSNGKFAPIFSEWAKKDNLITVVDDGTFSNETRLGAVKDIKFAIEKLSLDDDILVIAGDNVLDFSLTRFLEYAKEKNTSSVMRYYEESEKKLTKMGVLDLEGDRVVEMQEKPLNPKTHWCCPPFYFYKRQDIKLIDEALNNGCGYDAPGSLVSWLCKKVIINAMEMLGNRYDVGNLQSYEEIKNNYKGITK